MDDIPIVWDLEDDPEIRTATFSTFGYTSAGRHLAVVWEHVGNDPLAIYPVTAYEAPEQRRKRR